MFHSLILLHLISLLSNICAVIKAAKNKLEESDKEGARRVQQSITSALTQANAQDKSLLSLIKLLAKHNISISKVRNEDFLSHLNVEGVEYKVLADMMLHLTYIIEEKLKKEITGKHGSILHDDWSKNHRHYVALMACYFIKKGDDEVMVMRLLSCSTLPHNDDGGEQSIVCNSHFYRFPL